MNTFNKTASFVIPALNEAANINQTFITVSNAVSSSKLENYEIIFVDDGSSDGTGEIMDELASHSSCVRVIHNERNLGFGAAYLKGIKLAEQEYVMIIAGDNIMPATSITAILNSMGTTDIILPYMTDDNHREPVRRYGSRFFTQLVNLISGHNIHYYNGMVARRALFMNAEIRATGYSLQAECVIKFLRDGATYNEIGVVCGHETSGKTSSKALQLKNLFNLFQSLLQLFLETAQLPSKRISADTGKSSLNCK